MSLRITRLHMTSYSESDPLNGSIEVAGDHGEIKLRLTEDHCKRILNVVGEALIEDAKEVARALTSELIDHMMPPQLEAPDKPQRGTPTRGNSRQHLR